MKSLLGAFLVLLVVWAPPLAAEDAPAPVKDPAARQVEDAGLAANDVGYLVVDVDTGEVLAAYNADRPFIPASVVKIPTFAAALAVLGEDHQFITTLFADGPVEDGVLKGSLILRGGGDPFLTGDDLQAMAKGLAEAGIRKVEGPFLYDASALIEIPQINTLQPEAVGYNTGISALSLNFNRVRLFWKNDGANRSAAVAAMSENLNLPLDSVGLAFAEENLPGPFVYDGAPGHDNWLLSADLEPSGEDWLPVANPSLVTASVFRELAATEGIVLEAPQPGAVPEGAQAAVVHESPDLAEIARGVLRYSNNLSAELVGLATSASLAGRALTLNQSGGALGAWWTLRAPGTDWSSLIMENHSGLSSRSRATPRQIVTMLELAADSDEPDAFHDLLRQIQWKGVKGSARVKTGTMSYVRGLAGYIDTAKGNRLAFAIFANDLDKRAALDAAFDPHVRVVDPDSRRWRSRALNLEQALTTDWSERY